ncbi:MAG: hypothetical protein P8X77_02570 [Maritimibacter sp.]
MQMVLYSDPRHREGPQSGYEKEMAQIKVLIASQREWSRRRNWLRLRATLFGRRKLKVQNNLTGGAKGAPVRLT